MIDDCKRCGDPLFSYMERCAGCGVENPGFERSEPPRDEVFTTHQGTERGLFALGLGGLVAGGRLFSLTKVVPAWHLWLAGFCGLAGVALLVAFRRLTVSDLSPSWITALRIAMGVAAALFAWATLLAR
jgi:hypothetical protein